LKAILEACFKYADDMESAKSSENVSKIMHVI